MKKVFLLLMALVMLLSGCGFNTTSENPILTPPTMSDENSSSIPDEKFEHFLSTLTPEQREQVEQLRGLQEYYETEYVSIYDFCSLRIAEASAANDRLDRANSTLLNGIPLIMEVEFDRDTEASANIPSGMFIMGCAEDSLPFPYPNHWVGVKTKALVFSVYPGDCLTINGAEFLADETGIVKFPVMDGNIPEYIDIEWVCDDITVTAQIAPVPSADTSKEDFTTDGPPISPEERQRIVNELRRELSAGQFEFVEELDFSINSFQDEIKECINILESVNNLMELIEKDLAVAENALLNGSPFVMDVSFVSKDYSGLFTGSAFLLASPNGEIEPFVYPNPWVDALVVEMVFYGYPGDVLTINGKSFTTDEYGVVTIPIESGSIDATLKITWEYDGNEFSTILDSKMNAEVDIVFDNEGLITADT